MNQLWTCRIPHIAAPIYRADLEQYLAKTTRYAIGSVIQVRQYGIIT